MTFVLRFLQHLDLPDDDMSERVDTLLDDLISEHITDQVLDEASQQTLLGTLLENVSGSFTDGLHLAVPSIRSFGELFLLFLGERVHKHSHHESINSLNIYEDVDERMPLTDELAQFVSGHV